MISLGVYKKLIRNNPYKFQTVKPNQIGEFTKRCDKAKQSRAATRTTSADVIHFNGRISIMQREPQTPDQSTHSIL